MWQADGRELRGALFTDSPIKLKAGGKPEVSPLESQGGLEGSPSAQSGAAPGTGGRRARSARGCGGGVELGCPESLGGEQDARE